ncbi:MAG: branched-chain amino acid ABC transporter permease [Candidatus Tectomicrobia bacterium]|nr:branched-chain amino acid ABC transporter permease [Candidatus Tectomicrobia bacterium]
MAERTPGWVYAVYLALALAGAGLPLALAWEGFVGWLAQARSMTSLAVTLQVLASGILQGGLYAVIAMGLTMIFGVMRIINVAHGEFLMVGAYMAFVFFMMLLPEELHSLFTSNLGMAILGVGVFLLICLPLMFLFGMGVQRLLLNPVVGGPELTPLLITFGLSLILINTFISVFSSDFRAIPYMSGALVVGNLALGYPQVISVAVSAAVTGGVFGFLKFSRLGKAVRATAQNADVAMVCGVNVERIYLYTFGFGTALAATGGVLISIQLAFSPEIGGIYILRSFAIIILGGRGNYLGALAGGILLGVIEGFISFFVSQGSQLQELAAYTLLVFMLLVRPQGLLGGIADE